MQWLKEKGQKDK